MAAARALYDHPAEGIIRVRVPLPFPLRWVNAYVLPEPDGRRWTLIDPGLHTPESVSLWEQVLEELGLRMGDLIQVVLTHHHPDHYGLAGWFQERSGAPVRLSPEGQAQAERLWGEGTPLTEETLRFFEQHGLEAEMLPALREHLDSFVSQVSPQPVITGLRTDDTLVMGGRMWSLYATPGHALGHLIFHQAEEELLLAGDHVLPRISPNVSYLPGTDPNPLASYLRSLKEVASLPARLVLPGHRDPFATLAERCKELEEHHRERLSRMEERLDDPMSAYALSEAIFGRELTVHTMRFAVSETVAHLILLEAEGRVSRQEREGRFYYQRTRR
ncbi:MBL fold metallo-hydrolase [Gorillibacterium sp. CAU 1737]|uniref:MBL fold metallo-hydrolase n=1 Tax=Gorillibacterium sp. CAU 1737 TaxID=3140362 RepID=UPI003260E28E